MVCAPEIVARPPVQTKRAKVAKDLRQGAVLLGAMKEAMPQYPLDKTFARALPEELASLSDAWKRE